MAPFPLKVAAKNSISRLKNLGSNKRTRLPLFIAAFATIGAIALLATKAATPFASVDLGAGSSATPPAAVIPDGGASGGSAVQFGGVVSPPPPADLPTPLTTGWQHTGVTLQPCSQTTINGTSAGTIVDGCDFPAGSSVTINGGGPVTLKRSRVRAMGENSTAVYIAPGAGPVTIEDVEITSLDRESINRIDRTIVIAKNNTLPVTITRLYAHDARRGLFITSQNNITIQDTYHAFNYNPPINSTDCGQERPHSSAISAAGGVYNLKIINTVLGGSECSIFSGLIATYPEQGANHDILIDGGLWICPSGSSFGIATGYGITSEQQNYGFTVRNLQISTQANSIGCGAGNGSRWNSSSSTVGPLGNPKVWENNTKYNPGQPDHGQPIAPESS